MVIVWPLKRKVRCVAWVSIGVPGFVLARSGWQVVKVKKIPVSEIGKVLLSGSVNDVFKYVPRHFGSVLSTRLPVDVSPVTRAYAAD